MAAESMLASSSTPSVLSTQSDEDASRTAAGEFRRSLLVELTVAAVEQRVLRRRRDLVARVAGEFSERLLCRAGVSAPPEEGDRALQHADVIVIGEARECGRSVRSRFGKHALEDVENHVARARAL